MVRHFVLVVFCYFIGQLGSAAAFDTLVVIASSYHVHQQNWYWPVRSSAALLIGVLNLGDHLLSIIFTGFWVL